MIQASIAVLDCSIFNNPLRPMYAYQSRGERRGPTISEPGLATRRPLCLMLKRLEPSAITQKAWFFYISLSCPNLTQFWLKPARKCVQIFSLVPVNRRFSNFFFVSIHVHPHFLKVLSRKPHAFFLTPCDVKMLKVAGNYQEDTRKVFYPMMMMAQSSKHYLKKYER